MKSILDLIILLVLPILIIGCDNNTEGSLPADTSTKLPYECYHTYENAILPNGDSASIIFIKYPLSTEKDAVMTFGNKLSTPNVYFDLSDIFIYNKSDSLNEYSRKDKNRVFGHMTDNIQPIRINVVNHADGDFANISSPFFTGGFHGYQNITSSEVLPTMKEINKVITADGETILPGEKRKCKNIKMTVKNFLQASNTEKADGTGRYAIEQDIMVDFHNDTAFVKVDFTPIEDIKAYQVGGLSFYNDLDNIQFIGSQTESGIYPPNIIIRADRNVKTIRQFNDFYIFDVSIDDNYGIGDLRYDFSPYNAEITDACKSYFHLIETSDTNPVIFLKGQTFSFKGEYVFRLNEK